MRNISKRTIVSISSLFLSATIALVLIGCVGDPQGLKPPIANPVCKGVYALVAKEITAEYNIEQSRSLVSKLVAAAEADVEAIRVLKRAKVEGLAEAKLGSELKGVVKTTSSVTTDFFQQDQSFAQAACYFQAVLQDDLSESDRKYFEGARQKLAKNRVTYLDVLTGLKKN